jgi:conjugal transfer pilus assembly protein TraV
MNPNHPIMRHASKLTCCVLSVCAAVLLSACASSMSGIGGSATYACKAPQGVQCNSVSGNYYNALQHNLPSQRQRHPSDDANNGTASGMQPMPSVNKTSAQDASPLPLAASPLRSQSRVLRLWFKPWEDADHDLVDQGFVYVQIDSGRWLIDHVQQRIRDAYAPILPPHTSSASGTMPATTTASPPEQHFFGADAPDNPAGPFSAPLSPPISAPQKPSSDSTDLPDDGGQEAPSMKE